MSDHDTAPDPIDAAYSEAEAMLSDEAARATRRERVLAAVARQPVSPQTSPSSVRPRLWRRGGWLVAASVAGLGLYLTAQLYQPVWRQPQTAPATRPVQAPATRPIAPKPSPPAGVTVNAPPARPLAASPRASPAASAQAAPSPVPALREAPPAPAPSAGLAAAPAPQAFPSAESAPQPAPPAAGANQPQSRLGEVDTGAAAKAQNLAEAAEKSGRTSAPVANSAFAAPRRDTVEVEQRDESLGGVQGARGRADLGARLRAAAAAGRTLELQALLDRGAPVDAPDAVGDTALIAAIKADQPAAATILVRHGASLDSRNNAGENAKDIAARKGDAKLNQAIGLAP